MFTSGARLLRQINPIYQPHYEHLMASRLYDELAGAGLLVRHAEVDPKSVKAVGAYKVIEPERAPVITYPYEWSFSQLKDAALATLEAHRRALAHGMTLKDASAYNIQFINGRAVLIDTLSFEIAVEGRPWVAYRQFCQHFIAPLALMAHVDIRLGLLLREHIDGVPIDMAAKLLPRRTLLDFNLLAHIHAQAAASKRARGGAGAAADRRQHVSAQGMIALAKGLISAVKSFNWKPDLTRWADYYNQGDSYTSAGFEHKQKLVGEFLKESWAKTLLDLGANTGLYSRIAGGLDIFTLSTDSDPGAVELNYQEVVKRKTTNILPALIDLTNPSPALGWANAERDSFAERYSADCALALALIHHLAISNNVPLPAVAAFFASLSEWLIIEFVPKSDPKSQILLATRKDIFDGYTWEGFEAAFGETHKIQRAEPIADSERRLCLMRRK